MKFLDHFFDTIRKGLAVEVTKDFRSLSIAGKSAVAGQRSRGGRAPIDESLVAAEAVAMVGDWMSKQQ